MAVARKQLPAKESALFRSIVKCYEIKQYKKGLKAADAILKKYPDHGETLAMKGLTLNCMGRKEEAYEFVKNGLRHDLRSHVCWHVFGLLYRSDRNYHEAIKCYRNALRIDPENLQILRDLYLLQVQMRDLKGFAETRRTMLTLKPNNRNNWIGFAIAHHLVGNYQMAIDIIVKYFSTLDSERVATYEDSEIYLYQNQLIEETGDVHKALSHLEESKTRILDTLAWRQKKGQYLLQLLRYEEARGIFEELLEINFDNHEYHCGLQCAILKRHDFYVTNASLKTLLMPSERIDSFNEEKLVSTLLCFYTDKMATHTNTTLVSLRFLIDFTKGAAFQKYTDVYLKKQLKKQVPSLGADLKPLYVQEDKVKVLEELLLGYLATLKAQKPLDEDDLTATSSTEQVLLWTYYLAAQHYDRLGKYVEAMKYINLCITREPTQLDFFQRKARILKHMGDLNTAADVMVAGRKLDLADRYINNKATEYLLHADRVDEADATIALFTRHEGDPQQNLYDMQCMWYENEVGWSQVRQKKYGLALKRFVAVKTHFDDFIDDQFDFHTYCIRKMTLRSYIQLLRLCDGFYGREFFVNAAHGAIACYQALADAQEAKAKEEAKSAVATATMSAADKKKAKRVQAKARKAAFKKKNKDEDGHVKENKDENEVVKNGKIKATATPVKDDDPFGLKLVAKPPLEEAWRFVSLLQRYAFDDAKTHLAAFDIALRKKKYLLCLQALLKLHQLPVVTTEMNTELNLRYAVFQEELQYVKNPIVLQVIQAKKAELKM
ncbi:hypothetical protein CCR75_001905 [Bremia lactucae]|uniref:Uncharacterized protein n=1 Tax=Bremia lactucae TaxID=4779 RepID=A0A976ICJ5_BRELC|nr:hypothetical protein CCR75_001905 [Bremia lactucae]